MKIPHKTKAQRILLRKMKMWPFLWVIVNDYREGILTTNWLTGEFRYIIK